MSNNPNNIPFQINFQFVQQHQSAQDQIARVFMQNQRNQPQPQPQRFDEPRMRNEEHRMRIEEQRMQMQIEDNYSNPFSEIQKEQVSQKLEQELIQQSNGIKQKIYYFEPLIGNYENIQKQISDYLKNSSIKNFSDYNMDLQQFLEDIKCYVNNHKQSVDKIKMFQVYKGRFFSSQNNIIEQFNIGEEIKNILDDLLFLEQMMSDLKLLEIINLICQADKYQKDYIVIRALAEKQQKVYDYLDQIKTIEQDSQFKLGVDDFIQFIQLLNQYYEYEALCENNKSQIKVVYSEDIATFKNYAYEKNLYLFYHQKANQVNLVSQGNQANQADQANKNEPQCIIILISEQQIKAIFLAAAMRPMLLEIQKAVEYNDNINIPKMAKSSTFNESVDTFLQMVGIRAEQKEIKKFLIRFQNYKKNEFLDVFEFREVMMLTKQN